MAPIARTELFTVLRVLALLLFLGAGCSAAAPRRTGANNAGTGAAANGGSAGSAGAAGAAGAAGGFGNGSLDAAVGGESGSSATDIDGCAGVSVQAKVDVKPGNVLVLFDQSLTMADPWNEPGGQSSAKYVAASKALIDAVTPIVAQVNLGALFFPTAAATNPIDLCTAHVAPITMAPQLGIQPGSAFVPLWNAHFATNPLLLGTPLNEALELADTALMDSTLLGNTAVVIFTDGQWTCVAGGREEAAVTAMAARGIKTYIVGLPGAAGVAGLDALAKAGGTASAGCTSNCFLLPDDTVELQQQLSKIVVETAGFESCTFSIEGKIVDADLACSGGKVKIDDDMDIACDANDGFTIDDETHVTFHGSSCEALKTSAGRLDARFPCDVVVVPE